MAKEPEAVLPLPIAVALPEILARDDIVLPFRAEGSGVLGRLVRLGPLVDEVLSRHDYPDPVSVVLGEALALTALLGAALKYDSKITLQTKTDGPVDFIVVSYDSPGKLRGYASFNRARIAEVTRPEQVLGKGHLAMTIEPGGDMERYQGIVELKGPTLAAAALDYFRQSEQLPTFLSLAVARHYAAEPLKTQRGWHWRAGGILIQHLTTEGGTTSGDRLKGDGTGFEHDDNWERTRLLAATVEDHELLDPLLAPERLLYRLFHEEGVRVFPAKELEVHCTCSRERLGSLLKRFPAEDIADMVEADGSIKATCEFCSTNYAFAPAEFAGQEGDAPE
jgi:molecular chaperone Hsp33